MRKRIIVEIFVTLFLVVSIFNFTLFLMTPTQADKITGSSVMGSLSLFVEGIDYFINITSPKNSSIYVFNLGENYTFDLNVTSSSPIDTWWFNLTDVTNNLIINSTTTFIPNSTFNAVLGENRLVVTANTTTGVTLTDEVIFYVQLPNTAPIINDTNDSFYFCEDSTAYISLNAYDADSDPLEVSLNPTNPFYIFPLTTSGTINSELVIFSGYLDSTDAGNYSEIVSVNDGEYSDSKNINITVIEINDAPVMDLIPVQTVYLQGENSSFNKTVVVSDEEEVDNDPGNFNYTVSFSGDFLFNISDLGVMNYTPNSSQVGVHNVSVCATDRGILNIHPNISLCGQTGGPITVCRNFSLTVTEENRPPTIVDYYPNQSISITSEETIYLNATGYDPDGTIPDAYWYVDDDLVEYDTGNLTTDLSYSFGCDSFGLHNIRIDITDGLLNDSFEWDVDISYTACPVASSSGGGGGGGGGSNKKVCEEQWACGVWNVCQKAQETLTEGILSGEDYRKIKGFCDAGFFSDEICGVQTRECFDLHSCNTTYYQPELLQACHYVENPSCNDGVKNCHSESCEVLVDCGGPCGACPTCSDGKKNQGEGGIDCGGPCPFVCAVEKPFFEGANILSNPVTLGILALIFLTMITIIVLKIIRIYSVKRKKEENYGEK